MKSNNIFSFSFQPVSMKDRMKDIIQILKTKKASPDGDILVKLVKMNEDIFLKLIFQNFNQSMYLRILPVISKIYERLMYEQMYRYFDQIFSKFQCGFHKRFNTQNCLLYMIENWKEF